MHKSRPLWPGPLLGTRSPIKLILILIYIQYLLQMGTICKFQNIGVFIFFTF